MRDNEPGRRPNPTIEYLQQAYLADQQIDSLIEKSQSYMDKAMRATSRMTATRIGGSSGRSNVEDNVIALVDLSRDFGREAERLAEIVRDIKSVIEKVRNIRHRRLLMWRYINGWRWGRIAEGLGIDDISGVFKLHGRALESVEAVRAKMSSNVY